MAKAPKKAQAPKKAKADELREEAKFVFRGTVQQRGAATLDQVPLTKQTLIVSAEEILCSPEVLQGFEGMEITVQLGAGQKAEVGKSYVFYTNGWIYGDGLAVQCVALGADSDSDRRKARAVLEVAPDRAIQERAKRAELVVTGEIAEVRRAPRMPGEPITEHDPGWQEAVIAVDSVQQAATATARKPKQVVIRFASSPDVRWAQAPKFSVGQAGTWMLGDKDKKEGAALRAAAGAQKNEYVVVDEEDFQPLESSERVASLLKKK